MDVKKVTEALLYICPKLRVQGHYQMMKMLYWADKYHLSHYGRTLTGDTYYKLPDGPVPTRIYDQIKDGSLTEGNFKRDKYILTPLREPDLNQLSESDLEALNFALDNYGHMDYDQIRRESHDASWEAAVDSASISFDNFILTFDKETQKDLKEYISG